MNYNIYYENELVSTLNKVRDTMDSKLYMSPRIHINSMLTYSHAA